MHLFPKTNSTSKKVWTGVIKIQYCTRLDYLGRGLFGTLLVRAVGTSSKVGLEGGGWQTYKNREKGLIPIFLHMLYNNFTKKWGHGAPGPPGSYTDLLVKGQGCKPTGILKWGYIKFHFL